MKTFSVIIFIFIYSLSFPALAKNSYSLLSNDFSGNQCIAEEHILNCQSTSQNSISSSHFSETCSNGNNSASAEIVITGEGRVDISTSPYLKKGQNIYKSWPNTELYNVFGQNLGSIKNLTKKLNEDNKFLLFKNRSLNLIGLMKKKWTSVKNHNTAFAQPAELIEIIVLESQPCETDCGCAADCIVEAILSPQPVTTICDFVGVCSDLCSETRLNLNGILEEAINDTIEGACGGLASIIEAILGDEVGLLVTLIVADAGCLIGCLEKNHNVNLEKICNDLSIVGAPFRAAACLTNSSAQDVGITEGFVTEVGKESNKSQISISGNFSFNGEIDFTTSTVRIYNLLSENLGTGELMRENTDVGESFLLPIFLQQMESNNEEIKDNSETLSYQTPSNITPEFYMTIEKIDNNDLYYFNLEVNNASAPELPILCNGDPSSTEITTSFIIDDSISIPLRVEATENWNCNLSENNELTLGNSSENIGNGCSIIRPDNKPEFPIINLLFLLPLLFSLIRLHINRN